MAKNVLQKEDPNTPESLKDYQLKLSQENAKKDPAFTRVEIAKRFSNIMSLATHQAAAKEGLSAKYALIDTLELVVYLCGYMKSYRVVYEVEVIVRRDWKVYRSSREYRNKIDAKQKSARHAVFLRSINPKKPDMLIMNSHNGSMACRVYIGKFTPNMTFETIFENFVFKHNWETVDTVRREITTSLMQEYKFKKNKKICDPEAVLEKFLLVQDFKFPNTTYKTILERIENQDVWSYDEVEKLLVKELANETWQKKRPLGVTAMDRRAKKTKLINEFFVQFY